MLSIVLDGLILALLLAAFGLGARLHLSLRRLRQDGEFERLIEGLDRATGRAEAALEELRRTATAAGARIDDKRAEAQGLIDDLRFLADRADQIAESLAEQIRESRALAAHAAVPRPLEAQTTPGAAEVAPSAELRQALRALR